MIRAQPHEAPRIAAFLARAPHRAMFPLSNLAAHGMDGDHPFSMRFWTRQEAGQITDILGLSQGGMILPALDPQLAGAALALSGHHVSGLAGPADQCRAIESALGLQGAAKTLDCDEPHFLLELADLILPEGVGDLRPLSGAPQGIVRGWMADYHGNTLGTPQGRIAGAVEGWMDKALADQSLQVLMDGKTPLAMSGFNARLPQIVQVGGVYTPPQLRGRGHARRAVALHLAQARAEGVRAATLFSGSPAAARAYIAIGFRQVGSWSLILLRAPQVLP